MNENKYDGHGNSIYGGEEIPNANYGSDKKVDKIPEKGINGNRRYKKLGTGIFLRLFHILKLRNLKKNFDQSFNLSYR